MGIIEIVMTNFLIGIPEIFFISCFTLLLVANKYNISGLTDQKFVKRVMTDLLVYVLLLCPLVITLINFWSGLDLYARIPINIVIISLFLIQGFNFSSKYDENERYLELIRNDKVDLMRQYKKETKYYIYCVEKNGEAHIKNKISRYIFSCVTIFVIFMITLENINIFILEVLFNFSIVGYEVTLLTRFTLFIPTAIVSYFIIGFLWLYVSNKGKHRILKAIQRDRKIKMLLLLEFILISVIITVIYKNNSLISGDIKLTVITMIYSIILVQFIGSIYMIHYRRK